MGQEGKLQIGQVAFTLSDFLGMGAIGLVAEELWLSFGYGYSDPSVSGQGYLAYAIPITFAVIALVCGVMANGSRRVEALKHSQLITVLVGIATAVSALFIAGPTPFVVSQEAVIVCSAVHNIGILYFLFLGFHILAESRDMLMQCIMVHLVPVVMFLCNGLFFMSGGSGSLVLYVAFPLIATVFLVLAAWFSTHEWGQGGRQFWIASSATALKMDKAAGIDTEAPNSARNSTTRRFLILILVSILLMSFYVAFVRAYGLRGSTGVETHSVGASTSLGLVAIFFLVVLAIVLTTGRQGFMHVYYLISGVGICFAAVMLLLLGNQNSSVVRVIENASYILYATAVFYALLSWAVTMRLYVSRLFARVGVMFGLGTALGWLCENLYMGFVDDSGMKIILLVLSFGVFAYLAFGFSPQEYKRFISIGKGVQAAQQLAPDVADELVSAGVGMQGGCQSLFDQADSTAASAPALVSAPAAAPAPAPAPVSAPAPATAPASAPATATAAVPASVPAAASSASASAPAPAPASAVPSASAAPAPAPAPASAVPFASAAANDDSRKPPKHGMTFREATAEAAKRADLSKREIEILHLLLKGYSDQRIAEELVLSYHTVRSHVRHIYVKMDVHNREEISDVINSVQDEAQ